MPIYDLKCLNCGETKANHLQMNLKSEIPDCPKCGTKFTKLPGGIAVVYKGRGWTKKVVDDIRRSPLDQSKHWEANMIEKFKEEDRQRAINKQKRIQ